MELDEMMNDFFKKREICPKCGSKNFDFLKNQKLSKITEKKIICRFCHHPHDFKERISLDEWRKKLLDGFIDDEHK
jgi:hypothetical protein